MDFFCKKPFPHSQRAPNWHIYEHDEPDNLYGFSPSVAPHWVTGSLKFSMLKHEWHALRPQSPLQSFQMIQKKTLVIKQHLTHLETVKLRAFSHECERFGSEISLAPLAAAAADEPKMRGFPRFWIISLTLLFATPHSSHNK